MKKLTGFFIIAAVLSLMAAGCRFDSGNREGGQLKKKKIRIAITDSGLGGLSVMEDIADRIVESGYYKDAELIFVNALFDAASGYNALQSREEKIRIFGSVLAGIEKRFSPDIIVVACNTLSVLIDDTGFTENSGVPVAGIVEPGVDMVFDALSADKSAIAVILGTETTIEESTHRKLLLERGIEGERILTQACPQLQAFIESNPEGEDTGMLISFYVNEALASSPSDSGKVYLSLNCSHFGYSMRLWEEALSDAAVLPGGVLDPNGRMADRIIRNGRGKENTGIRYSVISRVPLDNTESLVRIFNERSPGIAEALSNYSLEPGLF